MYFQIIPKKPANKNNVHLVEMPMERSNCADRAIPDRIMRFDIQSSKVREQVVRTVWCGCERHRSADDY
jgi:hypothetical protein